MAEQAYVIVHVPEGLALPDEVARAVDGLVSALDEAQEVEGFAAPPGTPWRTFMWGGDGGSQWVRPLSTDLMAQIDGVVAQGGG